MGGGVQKNWRCAGSDPYWPHQALGGRCTPQSGRRSQTAAGRRPHFAACRASQQTASCLLDKKREKGRKRAEGGWERGEERREKWYSWWHRSAELKGTCATPPPPLFFYQQSAVLLRLLLLLLLLLLILLFCGVPPHPGMRKIYSRFQRAIQVCHSDAWYRWCSEQCGFQVAVEREQEYFARLDKLLDRLVANLKENTEQEHVITFSQSHRNHIAHE